MIPYLSVIVPVYNTRNYLKKCISSVLSQSFKDLELILIDDGSDDGSAEICDWYKERDNRVVVVHKVNEGVIKARCNGAKLASGKVITFVDADDWITADAYEYALTKMGDADVYATGICRYYSEERILEQQNAVKCGYYDKKQIEEEIIPQMLWNATIDNWAIDPGLHIKLFRKDILMKQLANVENLNAYYGDDTAVVYPLMLEAESIVIDDKIYYFHRQREAGVTTPYFYDDAFFDKLYGVYLYLREVFQKSVYWDVLKEQLEHFYLRSVNLKRRYFTDYQLEEQAAFPFWKITKDSKVVLYGAGNYGQQYFKQNEQYRFCNIVLWVDKNYENLNNSLIVSPSKIMEIEYDYIILGTGSAGIAWELLGILLRQGVRREKIIWSVAQTKKLP